MPGAGGGRVKEPRRLDSALDSVLESLGVAQAVERHAVFREWEERLGPEIEAAERAEAAGLGEPMRFANDLGQGAARVAKS